MRTTVYLLLLACALLLIGGCRIVYIDSEGARVGWIYHESITTNGVTFTTESVKGVGVYW